MDLMLMQDSKPSVPSKRKLFFVRVCKCMHDTFVNHSVTPLQLVEFQARPSCVPSLCVDVYEACEVEGSLELQIRTALSSCTLLCVKVVSTVKSFLAVLLVSSSNANLAAAFLSLSR